MDGTKPELTYLSMGWGVQSWCIAAMCALGELPPIDVAIHSDTGHEMQATYDHAAEWTPWLEARGVKVVTVSPENNDVVRRDWGKHTVVMVPAFSLAHKDGSSGQVKRQCTNRWKIMPIRKQLREILGTKRPRPGAVECWQGITLDEFHRMRTADVRYTHNVYPLVDRRMTRADCVQWLLAHGLPVPAKSGCTFCPYHSGAQWRTLKAKGGADWEHSVLADLEIRDQRAHVGFDMFMHSARVPLADAINIPEDEGAHQMEMDIPCDGGVCFV